MKWRSNPRVNPTSTSGLRPPVSAGYAHRYAFPSMPRE